MTAAQQTTITPPPIPDPVQPGGTPPSDLIAGKFKSQDDLVKAYKELEQKLGSTPPAPPATPEPKAEGGDPLKIEAPTEDAAKAAAAAAGIDWEGLTSEYASNKALAPETYEKLAKAGFPKAAVDAYVAGQEALAAQNVAKVAASVGGEEGLASTLAWAKSNLSASEIAAYNAVADTGDLAQITLALSGINARMVAATGRAPGSPIGGSPGNPSAAPFETWEQVQAEMRKPEYKSSPNFRAGVAARLAASQLA